MSHLRDLRPSGLSKLDSDRSMPEAARRSPRVSAPSDCSEGVPSGLNIDVGARQFATRQEDRTIASYMADSFHCTDVCHTCRRLETAAAKRFSPPRLVLTNLYTGPHTCAAINFLKPDLAVRCLL